MHTLMNRTKNIYITSLLSFLMLAAVCSLSLVCRVFWCRSSDGRFCGDNNVCHNRQYLCTTAKDGEVRDVGIISRYFRPTLIKVHACRTWFSTSAAADIAIALALLWQLSRIQSSFEATQRCTLISYFYWPCAWTLFSLIHKLMVSTIQTGAVTSIVAIIILITFLTDKESNGISWILRKWSISHHFYAFSVCWICVLPWPGVRYHYALQS
jgi:hypothetical protein